MVATIAFFQFYHIAAISVPPFSVTFKELLSNGSLQMPALSRSVLLSVPQPSWKSEHGKYTLTPKWWSGSHLRSDNTAFSCEIILIFIRKNKTIQSHDFRV
jgi:hypothetical protein